jgi:hypothetical protein
MRQIARMCVSCYIARMARITRNALKIENVDPALLHRLKLLALKNQMSLRSYVLAALNDIVDPVRPKAPEPEILGPDDIEHDEIRAEMGLTWGKLGTKMERNTGTGPALSIPGVVPASELPEHDPDMCQEFGCKLCKAIRRAEITRK